MVHEPLPEAHILPLIPERSALPDAQVPWHAQASARTRRPGLCRDYKPPRQGPPAHQPH